MVEVAGGEPMRMVTFIAVSTGSQVGAHYPLEFRVERKPQARPSKSEVLGFDPTLDRVVLLADPLLR